jgi:hypothetical protein
MLLTFVLFVVSFEEKIFEDEHEDAAWLMAMTTCFHVLSKIDDIPSDDGKTNTPHLS